MPSARFIVFTPLGTSTSTGRVDPGTIITLHFGKCGIRAMSSIARVDKKFSWRTVSAAESVKC
eukprot:1565264-Pleurochrysis_carterae.AAC.1